MAEKAKGPAIGAADPDPDTEVAGVPSFFLGMAGFVLYLFFIMWAPDATLDLLGPAAAAAIDDGPFFMIGFGVAVFALSLPRIRGWWHIAMFVAASAPFAVYYIAAGAAAALLDNHLAWGSVTAALLALLVLSAPVLFLHFRLFDRPEAEPRPAAPASAQRPRRIADLILLTIPALLALAMVIDLTEASGMSAAPSEIAWLFVAISPVSGAAIAIIRFDPSHRLIQSAVMTGGTLGACAIAMAAAAIAGPEPSPLVVFARDVAPMVFVFPAICWFATSDRDRNSATSTGA